MLRDLKFLRRNSGKNGEIENVPLEPKTSPAVQASLDSSRAPLNTIPEPSQNPKPETEASSKSKIESTPVKSKGKNGQGDPVLPLRTPEKHNLVASSKNRFGWPRNEPSKGTVDTYVDPRGNTGHFPNQVSRGPGSGNAGLSTPGTTRTVGRANSSYYSESNSTQSTPNRSVNKPPNVGFRSKIDGNGGGRWGNISALYRGVPSSTCSATVVDTVEVPHFDLKEDPSFWMEHNVQVLIRVRPLNSMELAMNGYSRCLKQESSQTITWIGQPETRFTFDHVACETVDQETLFRMVGLPMVENCISGYNSCMFAYGQTGSGKTYTMLGEIEDLEMKPSQHRGMTPRIFEFLFARIQAEEETQRAERLKYNCKCSFLEIYNEQITDLLDSSSTNLLLREDVKKGVYVENLSEFEVQNVSDVLKLLTQGSSNRKVAATNMNRESSRSHSVFTCIIESRWEKDSTTNLRFARLNLVDLAGSERQKTSGAEGDRLKEAVNINKSLSTLGHVIMILVDVANGKQRHVPYRDSRLTFLLQDSLGGNSKTIIIANVSPSMCSAAETLNTLKFAQRAKLIKNNAVVNEDSTGDVTALLNQIRLLKEEVSALKRQNVSRALSFGSINSRNEKQVDEYASTSSNIGDDEQEADAFVGFESNSMVRLSTKQLKTLETTLAGALRREQMTEVSTKQLEAEIELLNRLVRQREEDTRCTKMMLKFREDKIQRMESLLSGSITSDTYLLEENKALYEEIQLLQAKLDRNPEVTRFARENIRLLDQLRRFQEFYEEGEREMLLLEVSKLRDQLLQSIDGTCNQHYCSRASTDSPEITQGNKKNDPLHLELKKTLKELEECKSNLSSCLEENAKLHGEICDLRSMLEKINADKCEQDSEKDLFKVTPPGCDIHKVQYKAKSQGCTCCAGKPIEDILDLQLELDILNIILKEQRTSQSEFEEKMTCLSKDLDFTRGELTSVKKLFDESMNELKEAKSVIEALESQQILSINEIEDLQNSNYRLKELLDRKELEITAIKKQLSYRSLRDPTPIEDAEGQNSPMEVRLKKMQESLEKAKRLNMWHQNGHGLHDSFDEETENVRRQAEAETAEVIVCLQEELAILQQQVQESQLNELEIKKKSVLSETESKVLKKKIDLITEENRQLLALIDKKDREVQALSEEWMLLDAELEEVLGDGDEALGLAWDELGHLSSCLPQRRIWISEQCSQIVRTISEKELLIEDLSRCLEDANSKRSNLESMLKSLRGAAVVITEAHQQECSEKESKIALLTSELQAKASLIAKLEETVKLNEEKMRHASACATAASVVVNRLSEMNHEHLNMLKQKDDLLEELAEMNLKKDVQLVEQAAVSQESDKQIESLRKDLAVCQGDCAKLTEELSEERQHVDMMRQKLEDMGESNILKAKSKLDELKVGLTTVWSSMNMSSNQEETSERIDDPASSSSTVVRERMCSRSLGDYAADLTDGMDLRTESCVQPLEKRTNICGCSCCLKRLNSKESIKEVDNRDITIILLKAEIESALESLKQVQAEIGKLRNEKKERLLYEEQGKETIKCLMNQLLALQETMRGFEEQGKLKMETYNCKVDALTQILRETCKYCCKTKKMLELEVDDIEITAAEKSAEASFILAKFEEAQDTLKEADIMINELMMANEKMKVDIGMLERVKASLTNERDMLMDEVQKLQSINNEKDLQFERLEKQIASHVMETRDLFGDLEADIAYFLETFKESLASFTYEFQIVKSLVLDSSKSVKLWLEDVWSEIVIRDCAVSSLHLCHMGILLETATGLNAENGLLQHGLRESNSLIADLRNHNEKSRKELEICRVLKGKLLSDIKNSFDRISRKEEETGDLSNKLAGFEKMILDLQFQEESMLKRSNCMGHQLTLLTKELDESDKNFLTSLFNQQKQLEAKEEALSEFEHLTVDLYAKVFESLILAMVMKEMEFQNSNIERRNSGYIVILNNIVSEMVLCQIDAELSKQVELDCMNENCLLKKEIGDTERTRLDLLSKLSESNLRITEMDEMIRTLEHDFELLKAIDCSNNILKAELAELLNSNMRLENQIQYLETDNKILIEEVKNKEIALEHLSTHVSAVDQQKQKLEDDTLLLKSSLQKLQVDIERKNEEPCCFQSSMVSLTEEHESLKKKILDLEFENSKVLQDLAERKFEFDTSFSCMKASKAENIELKEKISHNESTITNLQSDIDVKNADLKKLQDTQSCLMEDLHLKSQKLQLHADAVNRLEEENKQLSDELETQDRLKQEFITNYLQLVDKVYNSIGKLYGALETRSFICLENVVQQIAEDQEKAARFTEQFECLDSCIKGLIMENTEFEAELLRKDDVLKGLLFDISLLQESTSNTKDQKDEIEIMSSSLTALEDELAIKLGELEEAVASSQEFEAQVKEKTDMISALEQDIIREQQLRSVLSTENIELKVRIEDALAAKASAEEDLLQGRKVHESLEMELTEMANALDLMNSSNECLKSTLNALYIERDNFHEEVLKMKENLEKAEGKAQENAVVAAEAQQIAEARESYAHEKEEEVKLLEKSVEELERTINVLENKVDILQGEAERQCLLRQELELELQEIKSHMQNVENAESDVQRLLDEKKAELEKTVNEMDGLTRIVAKKDQEIAQLKAHISELNLHAEAQATEYKQKFKELEAMAEKVRSEGCSIQVANSLPYKSEKNASRPRGSGSPFKCIGLGLAQQMKSEKDEELTAARMRIEELESLFVNKQKEIFALNAKLAAAESMTHDVIRDLLGVKLDVTSYASLLYNHQMEKKAEKADIQSPKSSSQLKKQLKQFIEERQGWLEEIDRKQAELVSVQIALEKHRQHDQLLKTENEMLKVENVNYKKKVRELEGEISKLSGQQNLQQRIHHHAKIKEENNLLKIQNEELSLKLQRSEVMLSRVKEELARHRASIGKDPHINLDEEQRLNSKLKEVEEERIEVAQKLLDLCVNVLKVAGFSKHASEVCPSDAEEALERLKYKMNSMESELQDLKTKNRIINERIRLFELMPLQSSPVRTDENSCRTPRRVSQSTFHPSFDR